MITASTSGKDTPPSEKDAILRNQETALVKLGELYRDQKCVHPISF